MLKPKYQKIYSEILDSYFDSVEKICNQNGCSKSAFYRALKRENIEIPQRHNMSTCEQEKMELAVDMYSEGKSIATIAKALNMCEKTLSKYLHYLNIEIRDNYNKRQDLICNYNFFEIIDTEEKAYWLGFFFADGWISKARSYRISIELSKKDINHLEKFKKSIESNQDIKTRTRTNKVISTKELQYASITITNKKMFKDIEKYGCIESKTYEGNIKLELIPECFYKDFLRGYIDGDGCISKKGYYSFIIVVLNNNIADKLCIMFNKCTGLNFKISKKFEKLSKVPYNILSISKKEECIHALNILYSNSTIYLDRKYQRAIEKINMS